MAKRKSPQKPVTAKKKADPYHWTIEQDDFLLEQLIILKNEGKMSENSFKKQHFCTIAEQLEMKHPAKKGAPKTGASTGSRWQKVMHSYFR